jgi:hypothetical protein
VQVYGTVGLPDSAVRSCDRFQGWHGCPCASGTRLEVFVRYKPSISRRKEQDNLIRRFESEGYTLLNNLSGYKYKQAEREQERMRIEQFVLDLISRTQNHESTDEP